MPAVPAKSPVIDQLRRELLRSQVTQVPQSVVSSGFAGLDHLLPQSGLPSGSVIEWVSDEPGLRSTTVALRCAGRFMGKPGALAVVDAMNEFHPMSLNHLGIPMSRLLVVRPCQQPATSACGDATAGILSQDQRSEALWSLEQLARCPGVRVVITWIDRLSSTAQRRLQLAVEKSGVTVFLIRPVSALRQTSWADLRFHVQSASQPELPGDEEVTAAKTSRIAIQLVRSKNCVQHHGRVLLDCHHETGHVLEAAELADPAPIATASC